MKVLIISGGSIEEEFAREFLRDHSFDYMIAADKGLEVCDRLKLRIDYIVGDFDSILPGLIDQYEEDGTISIDRYNPVKDYTDTGIAMRKAVEMGADGVYFIGATGTRLDHSMSNIFCLNYLRERNIRGVILDPHNRITMPVETSFEIDRTSQYGKFVSFFPYSEEVTHLTLKGFKYPVTDRSMKKGDEGLFVSNEITDEHAFVSYDKGILIMIESRD